MKYLSVAEIAKNGIFPNAACEIIARKEKLKGHSLRERRGISPKPYKNRPYQQEKSCSDDPFRILKAEKTAKLSGGIYHHVQIELTYNSNHIEGSRLTHDQTRYIFETNTVGIENSAVKVDDVVEQQIIFVVSIWLSTMPPPHHGNIHQRPASNIKEWHDRFSAGVVCCRRL